MAQLYSWGARALFIGPAFGLSPHRNAVAVAAVGLQAPFELSWDEREYRRCRSALIPPNTLQHLRETLGAMAFLYVDAVSNDYAQLRSFAATRGERSHLDLQCEPQLLACLNRLRIGGATCWRETRTELEGLLKGGPAQTADERIVRTLHIIHEDPATRLSLAALARHAQLSPSRFTALFRQTTGVPVRRYKLWVAMGAAVRSMQRGASLTVASMDAGFSSPAHFSSAYRQMFGMEPSRLAISLQSLRPEAAAQAQ
jgi:AraC-like DNA-binding protein